MKDGANVLKVVVVEGSVGVVTIGDVGGRVGSGGMGVELGRAVTNTLHALFSTKLRTSGSLLYSPAYT